METTSASARPVAEQSAQHARLYAPSIFDRLGDLARNMPIPWWLFSLGISAALVGIEAIGRWLGGTNPFDKIYPLPSLIPATTGYWLGLLHYLDDAAVKPLARFRPAMSVSDDEYKQLEYKLTTMP